MSPKANQRNYKVGYAKPPKDSQFQKGQSGNPSGRPKGTLNIASTFEQALQEKIVIKENGHRKTVTKLEAGAKKWASQVAAGDSQAFKLMPGLIGVARSEQETNETVRFAEPYQRTRGEHIPGTTFDGTGKLKSNEKLVEAIREIYGLTDYMYERKPRVSDLATQAPDRGSAMNKDRHLG